MLDHEAALQFSRHLRHRLEELAHLALGQEADFSCAVHSLRRHAQAKQSAATTSAMTDAVAKAKQAP